jgi:WD40 repeat protein
VRSLDILLAQAREAEKKGAQSSSETIQLEINRSRFIENEIQSRQTKIKSQSEKETSETLLRKHRPTAAVTGIIKKIYKSTGDFVKVGEPIMQIQRTDVVIVEGYVPSQYAAGIRPGTTVFIEPSKPVSEDRDLGSVSHRREVTGVAVTGHKGRPLIVSSGLDNTVYVWDVFATKTTTRLAHPVGVKAIACTGPIAKTQFAVSGGEDGKLRIWDLTNPDKIAKEARTLEETHVAGVTAVAISPDGRYLASAAGRDVFVWDVSTGKKIYALPPEHKDTVTMLRFTPQATLVTASRDKCLKVWNVGANGASINMPLDHRAGAVDTLGVSSDGSRVLFDQDDGRLDVVGLADGRTVGTIQTAGAGRQSGAGKFSTLAVFSSDDSLILTAGGDGARAELTLWETPKPGSRAMEQRKLVTPTEAEVTCAAFSPDREKSFLVVGTKTGGVHVWTPPPPSERSRVRTGVVETILPFDDKTSQVRVRAVNAGDEHGDGMADRSKAKIIVPADAMPAGGAMAQPPATIVPVSGVLIPKPGEK